MLKRYIGLYGHMLKLNMKKELEYKTNFFIAFFTNLPLQVIEFLFIWVLFQNISSLRGWTFYEMSFIYGIMMTSKGLADVFFDNLYEICKGYVRQGLFDTMLTQPINIIFNMIAKDFYPGAVGGVFLGIIMMIVSVVHLGISFGILQIMLLILFIIIGMFIFGGIMLIATVSTLWLVESLEIVWTSHSFYQFALYPINLYNMFIRGFVTFIFPYAFVSYYPATYLLNKEQGYIAFLAPIVVCIIWFVAVKVWKFGLTKYSSTGS